MKRGGARRKGRDSGRRNDGTEGEGRKGGRRTEGEGRLGERRRSNERER